MKYKNVEITNEQLKEISKTINAKDVANQIKNNWSDYEKYVLKNSKSKFIYTIWEYTSYGLMVDLVECNENDKLTVKRGSL